MTKTKTDSNVIYFCQTKFHCMYTKRQGSCQKNVRDLDLVTYMNTIIKFE